MTQPMKQSIDHVHVSKHNYYLIVCVIVDSEHKPACKTYAFVGQVLDKTT